MGSDGIIICILELYNGSAGDFALGLESVEVEEFAIGSVHHFGSLQQILACEVVDCSNEK
jgi:hypothetical protein